tara:strand:+ start:411 stop:530 length:120 start_codon:yes stop_codon:yes gene_type:complete
VAFEQNGVSVEDLLLIEYRVLVSEGVEHLELALKVVESP